MTKPAPHLDDSAEVIVTEVGANLTFFEDSSERHFTGLELVLGYLLLQWFAEGFVKGAGQESGKQAVLKAKEALPAFKTRVRNWLSRPDPTPRGDAAAEQELATQARKALVEAQQSVAASNADDVTAVADAYEKALVGYLTGTGMLGPDAERIARKVRNETENQVRPAGH